MFLRGGLVFCVTFFTPLLMAEKKPLVDTFEVQTFADLEGCRKADKDVVLKYGLVSQMLKSATESGDVLLGNCIAEVHLAVLGLKELSKAALLQAEAIHREQGVLDVKSSERLKAVHQRVLAWLMTAKNCKGATSEAGDADLLGKYFGVSYDLKESTGDALYAYDESALLQGPFSVPMEAPVVQVGADRAATGLEPDMGAVESATPPPRPPDASPYMDMLLDGLFEKP